MAHCKTCAHWRGGARLRGECDQRAGRGFGAITSHNFGRGCADYDKRRPLAAPKTRPPTKASKGGRPRRTKADYQAEARGLRGEVRHLRGALARIDTSAGGLVVMARRLNLRDVQWLRGELARVAADKVRAAHRVGR